MKPLSMRCFVVSVCWMQIWHTGFCGQPRRTRASAFRILFCRTTTQENSHFFSVLLFNISFLMHRRILYLIMRGTLHHLSTSKIFCPVFVLEVMSGMVKGSWFCLTATDTDVPNPKYSYYKGTHLSVLEIFFFFFETGDPFIDHEPILQSDTKCLWTFRIPLPHNTRIRHLFC